MTTPSTVSDILDNQGVSGATEQARQPAGGATPLSHASVSQPIGAHQAQGHTPGPWELEGEGGHGLLTVAMSHEKAWMHFDPSVSSFGYDATEEMRANARLIAAAPELLSELEALVTAVTFADPPKLFNDVLCHEARVPVEFVTHARAAIAKAREQGL